MQKINSPKPEDKPRPTTTAKEDWFIVKESASAITTEPEKETVVQEVHTDRQEVADPKEQKKEEIRQAFQLIEDMIERGYRFSDEQMDLGIKISLTRIPEPAKGWFLEICTMIVHRPLWQVLWGQYVRCQENGQAQAPLMDPTWEPGNEMAAEFAICRYCDRQFHPVKYGQLFCSNAHSALWNRENKEVVNGN